MDDGGDRSSDLVDRAYQVGDAAVAVAPAAGDRTGLIRALAIVMIVLGGVCGLGTLVAAVVALYARTAAVLVAGLIYAVPAANLLSMGIASVRIAPWARRATLMSAFLWLGLIGIAGAVLTFSRLGGNGYEQLMSGVILCVALALAVLLIAAYTRPSVRATFERRRGG